MLTKTLTKIVLLLLSLPVFAGVEATHLSPIPLDVGAGCNSLFFRGIDEFRGTAFEVPRVTLGRGHEGLPVEILPINSDSDTKYMLTVYIYFPPTDEVLSGSGASSRRQDGNACNLDRAIDSMNQNASAGEKINRIAPLPLTRIEVSIPNIKAHGVIGEAEGDGRDVDILNYSGQSLAVSFPITENERRLFESRIVTLDGIQAQVRFGFEAGSQDGAVHAHVDLGHAIDRFNAAVSGQTVMAKADVEAALKSVLDTKTVTISVEQGSSGNTLSDVVGMIVDSVMKEVANLPPDAAPASDVEANPGLARVAVKAVVNILNSKLSQDVVYRNYSAPHSATALTTMNMQVTRVAEPGLQEVEVQAGYIDPSSGLILEKGMTISIAAAYQFVDTITYPVVHSWITSHDIQVLGLGGPDGLSSFSDTSISIENKNVSGTALAEGRSNSWGGYFATRYRWSRTQAYARRSHPKTERIESSREALFSLPVDVSFSANGLMHLIHFADLMGDHEGWSADFDDETGRLLLTAKKDLGVLQFRERMNGQDDLQLGSEVILDQISEWNISPMGKMSHGQTKVLKSDVDPIIKQRSIVFFVGRPTEGTATPAATPAALPAPITRQD